MSPRLLILFMIISFLMLSFRMDDPERMNKINTNSHYNFLTINQIKFWTSNTTWEGSNPRFQEGGFNYPGGENASQRLLSGDAIMWGGKVNGEIFTNGKYPYWGTLQAGKISDEGNPGDPSDEKYRVYQVLKGWETLPRGAARDKAEKDFNEWPVFDGAPWVDLDGDGIYSRGVDQPDYIGDGALFYVINDMSSTFPPWQSLYGQPLGIEMQCLTWAFRRGGDLGDVIFRKYKIINKGDNFIEDMYIGFYSGVVLGNAIDNYVACDTSLNIAYSYNQTNYDNVYGISPPAVGHKILQGPVTDSPGDSAFYEGRWIKDKKNMGLHSVQMMYAVLPDDDSELSPLPPNHRRGNVDIQLYNILTGKKWSGLPLINPVTLNETRFFLSGDPVEGTGWYEGGGWPSIFNMARPRPNTARNYTISTGGFNLAPYDTQVVVIATIAARGGNNLDAIIELKRKAEVIQSAFNSNFKLVPDPKPPVLHSYNKEDQVKLWWEVDPESYDEVDPFLSNRKFPDSTYSFEGYRIWQYRDIDGTDPHIISTIDIVNNVTNISGTTFANGTAVEVPVIFGSDSGIRRYLYMNEDHINQTPLYNGNQYYFGITSYVYSPRSSPQYIESEPYIIEVIPGKQKIDYSTVNDENDFLESYQVAGVSDGIVNIKVIDPAALTGNTYEIFFENNNINRISYSLKNINTSDTLYRFRREFDRDTLNKVVAEGFILIPQDRGLDSVNRFAGTDRKSAVRYVHEVKGPGGIVLNEPRWVFENFNSTNNWFISTLGSEPDEKQNINWLDKMGINEYEIRFTQEGSEFYSTGYNTVIRPALRNDPKGKGRVPFEIYNIGFDGSKNEKMIIKIWDRELRDSVWTRDDQTGKWEYIYAFLPEVVYSEPLPEFSGDMNLEKAALGYIGFNGDLPEEGTVIRIIPFKPFQPGDKYEVIIEKANTKNTETGKQNVDQISVFPNPYFGTHELERHGGQGFVRFTSLPTDVTLRLYTLGGVFVKRIDKSDINQYMDWDLKNENGDFVASGMYIAHLEMPGIGSKVLKIAVVMSKEFLNRF